MPAAVRSDREGRPIGLWKAWLVLPPARRLLYAFGTFGSSLLQQTVLLWVFYYYAPPAAAGLPARTTPGLLGIAVGLGRVIDAVVDPLVAHWSDRMRGPAGRRRPFILFGAPLMALAFILIWRPPDAGVSVTNFVYLSALLGAFFLLFTLVLNPYMALLPETTAPGRDRVGTAAWQTVFTLTGTAVAFVASAQLAARTDFPSMGLLLAPAGALPLLLSAMAVREDPVPDAGVGFPVAIRLVFRNPRFQIFIGGFALLWLGLSMVNLSMALVVTVLMGLPREAVGSVLGASVGASLLALPLVTAAAHRYGAHRTLLAALSMTVVVLPLLAGIGRWPVALSPPAQGYALVVVAGPPLAALFTLPNTLLADLAHATGAGRGPRIEGMFFAFQGLILNGTTSAASVTFGGLLEWLGYELGLRVTPLVAAIFVLAGIVVFRRYPAAAVAAQAAR